MRKTINTSEKHVLPISKKAYDDFIRRFQHTFNDMLKRPGLYNEAVSVFEAYLKGENVENCDITILIAFNMIRPEIDKAIIRSQSARRRAALRRQAKEAESPAPENDADSQDSVKPLPETPEQSTPKEPIMNRRQRRAAQRELMREQRRLARRKKRCAAA